MVACAPRRRRHRRALKRGEGAIERSRGGPRGVRGPCGRVSVGKPSSTAQDNIQFTYARARQRATAERPSARPFPLLSPRAAKSGATTRLRVYAAIFTVFSAGKKATRGEEEISTARVYSHAAGIAHGTRRLAQTPRNRPLPQASTTPVRRPASGLWRPRPWPATSRCCWTASFLKMTLPVMWRPSRL